jgi:hypothetical protein
MITIQSSGAQRLSDHPVYFYGVHIFHIPTFSLHSHDSVLIIKSSPWQLVQLEGFYSVWEIRSTIVGIYSNYTNMKHVYINMDVWMLDLLSYDPFNFARRRIKNEVWTNSQESADLQTVYSIIGYYCSDNNRLNKTQKSCLCVFMHHAVHLNLDHCMCKIFQMHHKLTRIHLLPPL